MSGGLTGRIEKLGWHFTIFVGLSSCVLTLCGCGAQFYKNLADRETKGVLWRKTPEVPNVDNDSLDISAPDPIELDKLKKAAKPSEFLGEYADREEGAKILPLPDALTMAIHHNRAYLTQKETIYVQALDYTLVRHELAPIFSAGGGWSYNSDSLQGDPSPAAVAATAATAEAVEGPDGGPDTVAATAAVVETEIDELIRTNTFSRNQNVGFSMLTRSGARLAADFTSDFLKFASGDTSINNSALTASVVQPLLQGGGFKVTMENLTQTDRDLLYTLRDFANFRRDFVVDIVSRYYNVLRARDQVRNNWVGYQGFKKNVEREKALAEEDRRTQADLGRILQAEFQAEIQWINSVRDYASQLDELKIELGMPVEEKIVLEESELDELEIINPKFDREKAVKVALVSRPDLVTSRDRVIDAKRQIDVAKVNLDPGLDFVAEYESISDPDDITPNINFDRRRWSTGFDLDLPIDRKEERNIFRTALINLDQAYRQQFLDYDQVRLQIYDDWRALEQARRNYDINQLSVELAERRLEEQILLGDIGRGEANDLVDAQQDLIDSRNQRTSSLVDHTLARLRLWRDMGILFINKDGSWIRKLEAEGSKSDDQN